MNHEMANRHHSEKIARKMKSKGYVDDSSDARSRDTSDLRMPMPSLLPRKHHRRQRSDISEYTRASLTSNEQGFMSLDIKRRDPPLTTLTTLGAFATRNKEKKAARAEPVTHLGLIPIFNEKDITVSAQVGEGPLSQVFLVNIRNDSHQYVLKVPNEDNDLNFQVISELKHIEDMTPHPNLMLITGLVPIRPKICILSDYADMGSLDRLHNVEDMTNEKRFQEICRDVAAGLEHLHSFKIVHRNLRCSNLLMNRHGTVLICDYASTRVLFDKDYKRRPNPKLPFEWKAPESLLTNKHTYKSDIWSMGVTFWEILSKGKRPYSSKLKRAHIPKRRLIEGIANGNITLQVPKNARGSPPSAYIVRQCLQLLPNHRPMASTLLQTIRSSLNHKKHSKLNKRDEDQSSVNTKETVKEMVVPMKRRGRMAPPLQRQQSNGWRSDLHLLEGKMEKGNTDAYPVDISREGSNNASSSGDGGECPSPPPTPPPPAQVPRKKPSSHEHLD